MLRLFATTFCCLLSAITLSSCKDSNKEFATQSFVGEYCQGGYLIRKSLDDTLTKLKADVDNGLSIVSVKSQLDGNIRGAIQIAESSSKQLHGPDAADVQLNAQLKSAMQQQPGDAAAKLYAFRSDVDKVPTNDVPAATAALKAVIAEIRELNALTTSADSTAIHASKRLLRNQTVRHPNFLIAFGYALRKRERERARSLRRS